MRQIRLLAIAGCIVAVAGSSTDAGGYGSYGGSTGYASSGGAVGYASYGGSSGGYASHGGSSGGYAVAGGSSGGSVGRVGPIRGLLAKIRAHKAARHASTGGSSGGSHGGYLTGSTGGSSGGSTGGSSGGYAVASGGSSGGYVAASPVRYAASTGGSTGGSSGGYATASYSAPVAVTSVPMSSSIGYSSPVTAASYAPTYSSPAYSSSSIGDSVSGGGIVDQGFDYGSSVIDSTVSNGTMLNSYKAARPAIDDDAALLQVMVPEDAVVLVNDRETASDGSLRKFMSKGLQEGYVYTYVIKATFDVDGEEVTRTKEVKLRPGDVESVEFDGSEQTADDQDDDADDAEDAEASDESDSDSPSSDRSPDEDDVVTTVRLHVPADAKVTLAGNPTDGSGLVRTFRTKSLVKGDAWKDYTVAVTTVVDGRAVTKRRTITVNAGDTKELTFDFEEAALAAK